MVDDDAEVEIDPNDLIGSIGLLAGEVNKLRTSNDKKLSRIRTAIVVATIVGLAGVGMGGYGFAQYHSANTERLERSIGACKQENASIRSGMRDVSTFIRKLSDKSTSDAAQLANLLDSKFKLRDCSAAGVQKYLTELNK